MQCEEARQLIDAYALSALEDEEARALEEHLAGCVSCWQELSEARAAAAAIGFVAPVAKADPSLRGAILRRTKRGARRRALVAGGRRARRLWPAAVGLAAASALGLAFVVQSQVSDLDSSNNRLQTDLASATRVMGQQQQMLSMLAVPDVLGVAMTARPHEPGVSGVYYYSQEMGWGAVSANNLPPLEEGQVYRLWLVMNGERVTAGDFTPWRGIAIYTFDFSSVQLMGAPDGVAVSAEPPRVEPSGMAEGYILYASFPAQSGE